MKPKPCPRGATVNTLTAFAAAIAVVMSLGAALPVFAETEAETANRLEALRQQIQALRSELDSHQQRKTTLQDQLRNTELRIGKVSALLKTLQRQLRRQRRKLDKLHDQRDDLQANLQTQRVALARQVRASYAIGQQEYLKILLNQQDPAAVTRTLTYYDYFHRARLARIQSIDTQLTELTKVEKDIQTETRKLEQNQREQTAEKTRLETTRGERTEVLAKLEEQIKTKGARLGALLEDQRRLQDLLNRLADNPQIAPPGLSTEQSERQAFARLRGQLSWPSHGKLSASFGKSRQVGELKWQGVLIEAPEGTDVRAISHGRVAFSDWLRGFGLLTIVDHGDGYMSLYGGNQSLYKEVGDWVETGEVIASVGNSGGRKDAALYFEIRHNGKPTNPLKWCRNTPNTVAKR